VTGLAAAFFLPICCLPLLRFGLRIRRLAMPIVLALSAVLPAYAQAGQSRTESAAHSAAKRQEKRAIRDAEVRLNQDLAALPKKLRRFGFGHWSVLSHEIRPADPESLPLRATVLLDYQPPSILSNHLFYRYLLHLDMQRHQWRLTSVEQRPYSDSRPPHLETYDYRPFRKMSPSRAEFRQFRSCFD
jgi:hypothetical protein